MIWIWKALSIYYVPITLLNKWSQTHKGIQLLAWLNQIFCRYIIAQKVIFLPWLQNQTKLWVPADIFRPPSIHDEWEWSENYPNESISLLQCWCSCQFFVHSSLYCAVKPCGFKPYCDPTAQGLTWVELSYCISFITTWVILLYACLLWIDGSYCTKIIVTRVILLY